MTVVSMSLGHCQFGNLMGMRPVMTLWPFPTACFLQCFNKGSLNVLCAPTALACLDITVYSVLSHVHMGSQEWEIQEEDSSCLWKWTSHMDNGSLSERCFPGGGVCIVDLEGAIDYGTHIHTCLFKPCRDTRRIWQPATLKTARVRTRNMMASLSQTSKSPEL